jgi:hypothetical protein
MGFDPQGFVDDYDHHDYAKDIHTGESRLQSRYLGEVARNELANDLQNYYAVTLLTKVQYSITIKDATRLYSRQVFGDTTSKAIEERVRQNVTSTLAKYGVTEGQSTTSDVPLIAVAVHIRNDPQVLNAVWIETKLIVRRTLLDPASKRPITATVWEDTSTRVHTKQYPHLLVTEEHPDLVDHIVHDVDNRVFLLAWSQYRTITTMKAAIQLDKEGILPEPFSEYVIKEADVK